MRCLACDWMLHNNMLLHQQHACNENEYRRKNCAMKPMWERLKRKNWKSASDWGSRVVAEELLKLIWAQLHAMADNVCVIWIRTRADDKHVSVSERKSHENASNLLSDTRVDSMARWKWFRVFPGFSTYTRQLTLFFSFLHRSLFSAICVFLLFLLAFSGLHCLMS